MEESRYKIMLPAYYTIRCYHHGDSVAFIHHIKDVKVSFNSTDNLSTRLVISVYLADSCLDVVSIYCDTFEIYDMSGQSHTVKELLINED